MVNPEEDGITHINVYSKGKTKLGRQLSNFSYSQFTHPEDGEFCSIEGYWYWLSSGDNKLRKLYGYQAKKYGRKVGGLDWPVKNEDEFRRKIRLAIKAKFNRNSGMREEFLKNVLPLKHYYVYGDKVVEPKEGTWVIEYLEQLKDEYKFESI